MARGELMKQLFKSYGQEQLFREVADQIIEEEEKKSNVILASSLRRALSENNTKNKIEEKVLRPLTHMVREKSDFLEEVKIRRSRHDIILSSENSAVMAGLLKEYLRGNEIRRLGLTVRSKVLFCGPPGCGKTLCAEVFAGELGLPLYVVKLDRLVSSYLGETASNVRKIFEFASVHPCVLFIDEFDAIARTRTDERENSEVRRVVTSLLLFIDQIVPKGFLIAATNLEGSLDPAIWRRFDEVVWFDRPDKAMASKYLKNKFKNVEKSFEPSEKIDELLGYSYAELDRICNQSIKSMVLENRNKVSIVDFSRAIVDERRRRSRVG